MDIQIKNQGISNLTILFCAVKTIISNSCNGTRAVIRYVRRTIRALARAQRLFLFNDCFFFFFFFARDYI